MSKTHNRHSASAFLRWRGKRIRRKYSYPPGFHGKAHIPGVPRPYEQLLGDYLCNEETDHMYLYIGSEPC
jgi:hypothetical protein